MVDPTACSPLSRTPLLRFTISTNVVFIGIGQQNENICFFLKPYSVCLCEKQTREGSLRASEVLTSTVRLLIAYCRVGVLFPFVLGNTEVAFVRVEHFTLSRQVRDQTTKKTGSKKTGIRKNSRGKLISHQPTNFTFIKFYRPIKF
jgi:hypothetical protein